VVSLNSILALHVEKSTGALTDEVPEVPDVPEVPNVPDVPAAGGALADKCSLSAIEDYWCIFFYAEKAINSRYNLLTDKTI
jgi:hypothetical protein